MLEQIKSKLKNRFRKRSVAWHALRLIYLILTGQIISIGYYKIIGLYRLKGLRDHGAKCLKKVLDICNYLQMTPFLTFGTLLGCRRDKKIIGWDNDLDFGLFIQDASKIQDLIELMRKENFILKFFEHLTGPLSKIGDIAIVQFMHKQFHVSVDFYFFYEIDHQIAYVEGNRYGYVYRDLLDACGIPSECVIGYASFYPARILSKLETVSFMDCDVRVPADTEGFLTETYGDWKTPQKKFNYKNVRAIVLDQTGQGLEFIPL